MSLLHWLVYSAWPVLGLSILFLGIIYSVFQVIKQNFLGLLPSASAVIFGLWAKELYKYSPNNLTHGTFFQELFEIFVHKSKFLADFESHWILLGLLPTIILSGYWYINKDEPDSVYVGIISGMSAIILIVSVIWIYYAPHTPSFLSTGLSYQN